MTGLPQRSLGNLRAAGQILDNRALTLSGRPHTLVGRSSGREQSNQSLKPVGVPV